MVVKDKGTALGLVQRGIPVNVQGTAEKPSRLAQPALALESTNLRGSDNPVSNLQYLHNSSKTLDSKYTSACHDDVYEDRKYPTGGEAFVRFPIDLLIALNAPPWLRILSVLVRHAAMRSVSRLKLRRQMWEEAGVNGKDARSRAIKSLEKKGAIRVERAPGTTPVVCLNINRRGEPQLWSGDPEPKLLPGRATHPSQESA